MPTDSSLPLGDFQTLSIDSENVRAQETFSNQTLILTALAAINNPSHHPTFNESQISKERLRYMKDKATNHTPIIDAATTILITDTEILATMARGVSSHTHSLFALKVDDLEEPKLELELKDFNTQGSHKI